MDSSRAKAAIESSSSILITSHLSPDYDAVCSSLLLGQTIRANYPHKQTAVVLEDQPYGMSGLDSNKIIQVMPIVTALAACQPDCLVILDANRLSGITRSDEAGVRSYIKDHAVQTMVIDHHEREGEDAFDIRIQDPTVPAVTQMIYDLCFRRLAMTKPKGYALLTMTGIVDDSGIFTYGYDNYSKTFAIVTELMRTGVAIQDAVNIIQRLDIPQLGIIGEFASNVHTEPDYAYSFISDEAVASWLRNNREPGKLKAACTAFCNRYIDNIDGRTWGVIIHPEVSGQPHKYRASFRAQMHAKKDILAVSKGLGGGNGHARAAGATFNAECIEEAIQQVLDAISRTE